MFLADHQLKALLGGPNALVTGFPDNWDRLSISDPKWDGRDSPVQPCSVDFHIGEIYIPGSKPQASGGEPAGVLDMELLSGHSVVVKSLEKLKVPNNIGAIALPPSSVSSKGIFIANFGHVDPGYEGYMRFTIINMGRAPYRLKKGDLVITVLFFETAPVAASWAKRFSGSRAFTQDEVDVLAKDFADLNTRIRLIAQEELGQSGWRYVVRTVVWPVIIGSAVGALLAIVGFWGTIHAVFAPKVDALQITQGQLQAKESAFEIRLGHFEKVQERLDQASDRERERLSQKLSDLEAQIKTLIEQR